MLDIFAVMLDGGMEERGCIGVAADEFGGRRKGEIDEIVEDEDLAVAIGTGADADGGNGQGGGDFGGSFAGNAFKNDGAGAGLGKREGIGLKLARCFRWCGPAPDSHPCGARFAASGRDGRRREFRHRVRARTSSTRGPSILTASAPASLTKRMALATSLGDRAVIAAEGHVGHDERAANGAADGARVVEHLVDGDGKGVFMAEDDLAERIADQDEIDACLVDKARGGVVVGGERRDGLALALHFAERGHGDFWEGNAGLREARARGKLGETHVFSSAAPKTQDATRTNKVYAGWRARISRVRH